MATGCAVGQVTVFSGAQRRRRWNVEERLENLNEAFAPGACVAKVTRRTMYRPHWSAECAIHRKGK